jgi:hypothetical protein
MPLRKLCLCFLGAALAASVLTTSCRGHHHDDRRDDSQPAQNQVAQPAQDETVIYNQWEAETHRAHRELAQRTADEQREYHDWRQQHPDRR